VKGVDLEMRLVRYSIDRDLPLCKVCVVLGRAGMAAGRILTSRRSEDVLQSEAKRSDRILVSLRGSVLCAGNAGSGGNVVTKFDAPASCRFGEDAARNRL